MHENAYIMHERGIMKHFSVVQSICRLALAGKDGVRQQVERLRDRLREDDDSKDAEALERLLSASEREASLVPSKVALSKTLVKGEVITDTTRAPVDRETSAPIADIILHPRAEPAAPKLTPENEAAVAELVEEWSRASALVELGIAPPYSCLIFGPPGTGKTLTAFSIAERMGLPLVRARIDGIVSSFLGTTSRNLGNLFDFANRYRCILLLDEFDAIAKLRDDPHEVGEIKRVVNTLLQNLDSRSGIGLTIAITNHQDLLDKAVWRRFSVRLELPPPRIEQRLYMLDTFMRPVEVPPQFNKAMAWLSDGFTGSDLRSMTDSIKRHLAMRGFDDHHAQWLEALRAFAARNAGGGRDQRSRILLLDQKEIAQRLSESEDPEFTKKEIAEILTADPSTVSRWTTKRAKLSGSS